MSKHEIGFTYTAQGTIVVDAKDDDEAFEKAIERLDQLQEMGSITTAAPDEITWDSDEVEAWQ